MTSQVAPPVPPLAIVAPVDAARRVGPCVGAEDDEHCTLGLLLGVACCPDGTCALCRATEDRQRRSGFPPAHVRRSMALRRVGLLDRCPICGFPPPAPMDVLPLLPRLDRLNRIASGSWDCRTCGRPLPQGKRHYCSHGCWREHVRRTEMDGDKIFTPAAPRAYRLCMN